MNNDFVVSVSKVENGYLIVVEEGAYTGMGDIKEFVAKDKWDAEFVLRNAVVDMILKEQESESEPGEGC
jgi:hypothetical protein